MPTAIINYELGNLRSVENALRFLGDDPFIAQEPAQLDRASHIVLPGVGAFGDGIDILRQRGWENKIREQALERRKPFLGICLGMQLLAARGLEHGEHEGLGLIGGVVRRIHAADNIRIPHIGWNAVRPITGKTMYQGMSGELDYYFVHSFVLEPEDPADVSGHCVHGETFVASIERGNVWGAQFHPEKSQHAGLALLKNFLRLV